MEYIYYRTIDSTNNEAKRLIASGEINGDNCLVAEVQTAGRGRQGKSFFSPDTGLYMTVVFPMDCPIASQVTMTVRTACAVAEAIEDLSRNFLPNGKNVGIKWVNDIYISGKKCSGILCEAVNDYDGGRMRYVIIGIGVNIYTKEWPDDLKDKAGSVFCSREELEKFVARAKTETHSEVSPKPSCHAENRIMEIEDLENMFDCVRGIFAKEIAEKLKVWLFERRKEEFINYYKSRSIVLGRKISYMENGNTKEGYAVDIDGDGGLVLEDGTILSSGEISVRL